ncbi:MAG: bifunctional phosphopantothenoylcysteine decarboxylase/phosphopantothenate--cysteine ligase CoaBC [Abditibacteriota bacterium]|nr:bifunctional phosphopantothenoylcysteine decarboxylase/phosphopantothenate--cysteine ligase CoaBC [Abditibacteriota bacterium]
MGNNILIGVTGSIAAYKACQLVSLLKKNGCSVKVIMTENAAHFVSELTFRTLSGNPVYTDMFGAPASYDVEHISLARWADTLVIAPADANIIGKLASGIADDMLSTVAMACRCPVYIAPAMNTAMYENAAVAGNMKTLEERGFIFIEPGSGRLACGDEGKGRLAEPEAIAERIAAARKKDLEGKTIAITAGATIAPVDPVRFLSNRSSGKMGAALAEAALERGAKVFVVHGRIGCRMPAGSVNVYAATNDDMYEALRSVCEKERPAAVIAAAAPCDYVCEPKAEKIKKNGKELLLRFSEGRDIIGSIARLEDHPVLAGFAAETENLVENARRKLEEKGLDMIVANDVSRDVFGSDYEQAVLIGKNGKMTETGRVPKRELADMILDMLSEIMP